MTSIKIDKENPNILTFKDVYAVERPEEDYYQTQFKILKSRNLARRVIRQMKLDMNPEFAAQKPGTAQASSFLKKEPLSKEDGIDSSLIDSFIKQNRSDSPAEIQACQRQLLVIRPAAIGAGDRLNSKILHRP